MESQYRKHNIYLFIYMLIFIMWLGSVFIKAARAEGNQIAVEKGDYFDCCEGWYDTKQLDLYICDLIGQGYSLTYGLYDEAGELIGISLGYIEFCIKTERQGSGAGTFFVREIEKAIKELGLKQIFLLTDSNVPAYQFYKKNGFVQCETNVAFAKVL